MCIRQRNSIKIRLTPHKQDCVPFSLIHALLPRLAEYSTCIGLLRVGLSFISCIIIKCFLTQENRSPRKPRKPQRAGCWPFGWWPRIIGRWQSQRDAAYCFQFWPGCRAKNAYRSRSFCRWNLSRLPAGLRIGVFHNDPSRCTQHCDGKALIQPSALQAGRSVHGRSRARWDIGSHGRLHGWPPEAASLSSSLA